MDSPHLWMILAGNRISDRYDHDRRIYRFSTWQGLLHKQDSPVEEALDFLYCAYSEE